MDSSSGSHHDSRDSRTQQDEAAHPVERRDTPSERRSSTPPQDPVNAVNPQARPSSFSMDDIDEGDTPLDEEMDMLIDPDVSSDRMSTNRDVLDLDSSWRVESEEPDFMGDPGTTDIIQAVEEAEPYFPPTDPPMRAGGLQNAEIMGGFAVTSLEEPMDDNDDPLRLSGDDEIAELVRHALLSDAYTADLAIDVEVEDGVVYLHGRVTSLEDIDQAEQVAGSVAGVEEVQEDLEIV